MITGTHCFVMHIQSSEKTTPVTKTRGGGGGGGSGFTMAITQGIPMSETK